MSREWDNLRKKMHPVDEPAGWDMYDRLRFHVMNTPAICHKVELVVEGMILLNEDDWDILLDAFQHVSTPAK